MESLSYAFEGTTLLFTDDTDFQVDCLVRNGNLFRKWDGDDPVDSIGFMEFTEHLLPDMMKKSLLGNQCLESSGDDAKDRPGKSVQSASTVTLNSLMEFGTKLSSCVNKANDDKFVPPRESDGNMSSIDNSVLSTPHHLASAKTAKVTSLHSPVPTCQVHGCNRDLSSSKEYHKRYKVCIVIRRLLWSS